MKQIIASVFIPVTRRVKGYTRFVGKYVTAEGSVSDPIKLYFIGRKGFLLPVIRYPLLVE